MTLLDSKPVRAAWLLRPPAADARLRLFCLPYSGCGASMYRSWPATIDGIDICPVQFPGRENRMREPGFARYEDLVADMLAGLAPFLDRPFAFFGHCASALIAYEATVQLAAAGTPAARLVVSSQVAPQDGPRGRFLDLDDAGLGAEVETLIRGAGGTPQPSLVAMATGILRGDVEANRRYVKPEPEDPGCPVTAVGWSSDQEVAPDLMAGWSRFGAQHEVLDGGHHDFMTFPDPLRAVLAGLLDRPTEG